VRHLTYIGAYIVDLCARILDIFVQINDIEVKITALKAWIKGARRVMLETAHNGEKGCGNDAKL
jgi:hypothetical protein